MRTCPEIAKQRVDTRARIGEVIPLEYLTNCHTYHENWMNKIMPENLLSLDGNIDLMTHKDHIDVWVREIATFCNITSTWV